MGKRLGLRRLSSKSYLVLAVLFDITGNKYLMLLRSLGGVGKPTSQPQPPQRFFRKHDCSQEFSVARNHCGAAQANDSDAAEMLGLTAPTVLNLGPSHRDGADPGLHLSLGAVAVPDEADPTIGKLQTRSLGQEGFDLQFHGSGQKLAGSRPALTPSVDRRSHRADEAARHC